MRRRIAEHSLFFREFVRNFHTTGAVLPSGRYLASALARFVDEESAEPRRILEVGPGTGAVTRRIVGAMRPTDHIDLVELNDAFVRQLERRFASEPAFQAVADRARVLHCPVEELPPTQRYNLIVSGLPLNNFAVADVERILATLTKLLASGGWNTASAANRRFRPWPIGPACCTARSKSCRAAGVTI
jgi:phosphatidylethanolamine/phosphatidyl-N-methylethanolamine N-methyltransferase